MVGIHLRPRAPPFDAFGITFFQPGFNPSGITHSFPTRSPTVTVLLPCCRAPRRYLRASPAPKPSAPAAPPAFCLQQACPESPRCNFSITSRAAQYSLGMRNSPGSVSRRPNIPLAVRPNKTCLCADDRTVRSKISSTANSCPLQAGCSRVGNRFRHPRYCGLAHREIHFDRINGPRPTSPVPGCQIHPTLPLEASPAPMPSIGAMSRVKSQVNSSPFRRSPRYS